MILFIVVLQITTKIGCIVDILLKAATCGCLRLLPAEYLLYCKYTHYLLAGMTK